MKRQNEFEETIRQVMQTMFEVAKSHQRTSAILENLAERQVNTEEYLRRFERSTDEAINRVAQKQAITQENLNVLLLTVERHIAGHKQ